MPTGSVDAAIVGVDKVGLLDPKQVRSAPPAGVSGMNNAENQPRSPRPELSVEEGPGDLALWPSSPVVKGGVTLWSRVTHAANILAYALAWTASVILLVVTCWITYGAFARYVLREPDRFVTEGTALLLLPLAFLALPYTLQMSGFPAARGLLASLPPVAKAACEAISVWLLVVVGLFLAGVSLQASWRAAMHGSRSIINEWPIAPFWILVALSTMLFAVMAIVRALRRNALEPR